MIPLQERKIVTHIISGIERGGAETFLARLVCAMTSWDHHVIALSPPSGSNLRDVFEQHAASLTILSLNQRPIGDMARLRALIKSQSPHIIQGWMYHGNMAASGASLGLSIPHVWNIRNGPMMGSRMGYLPLSSKTHCLVKGGALLSRWMPKKIIYNAVSSSQLHHSWGYDDRRSIILPNGIDTRLFAPNAEARRAIRSTWGVSEKDSVIGWVGRNHPQKNIPGFCAALSALSQKYPHVQGILYGLTGVDHPPGNVRLMPPQANMERIYPGFDFFCLSSTGESFPNVLLEAMSCGIPPITTHVGDSAIIVGPFGVIAPPGDLDALIRALDRALSTPKPDPDALRRHITQTYDLTKIIGLYEQLYQSLVH